MAEREGFEPSLGYYPKHAFQARLSFHQHPLFTGFSELLYYINIVSITYPSQFTLATTPTPRRARKSGALRQLESGYWQAIVRRTGHPQQSKTFRWKEDAEKWIRQVSADIERGVFQSTTAAERTTLSDLIKSFREEYAPHHYRKRDDAKEAWRFQLDRIEEGLGKFSLATLDQLKVAAFRDSRLAGSPGRPAVSNSTARKEIYLLSKVLTFAMTEKGITLPHGNPVEKIRKPQDSKGRTRRLSAAEWADFERECKKSRNRHLWPFVLLAVETAMRQNELLTLTWHQIDFQRRLALLTDPDKIKNEEPRAVPLSGTAIEALESLPRDMLGYVISVKRMALYHAFKYACDRADLHDFTLHDLRHEALSRLAERGNFSILELAAVSGHKTLQMLKRYTHLQAEKLADKLR